MFTDRPWPHKDFQQMATQSGDKDEMFIRLINSAVQCKSNTAYRMCSHSHNCSPVRQWLQLLRTHCDAQSLLSRLCGLALRLLSLTLARLRRLLAGRRLLLSRPCSCRAGTAMSPSLAKAYILVLPHTCARDGTSCEANALLHDRLRRGQARERMQPDVRAH